MDQGQKSTPPYHGLEEEKDRLLNKPLYVSLLTACLFSHERQHDYSGD